MLGNVVSNEVVLAELSQVSLIDVCIETLR